MKRSCLLLLLSAAAGLGFIPDVHGQLRLTEFLASNDNNIKDEDGTASDWIEIQNTGHQPVNLEGWYLTDDPNNLTKWRFPATNLNAGALMIVWASEKDRRVPGAPLHTNFRLRAGGEFLALVEPDGQTLATVFDPYPPQVPDVSYGFGLLATNQLLIATNEAPVRILVPTDASLGTNWLGPDFNDGTWLAGLNGVGYGTTNVTTADYGAAVLPTSPFGYWRLDEASGNTAVNVGSGANLDGTYQNVILDQPGPRPPDFPGFEPDNRAVRFNGTSSSVRGPTSLLSGLSQFTLAGWVNPAVQPGSRIGLFGQNDCIEFGFISGRTIQCWTPGGGSVNVNYPFPFNTWHHIVAVGDGTRIRIYLDGVEAGAGGSATANYGSSAFPFNIGGGGIYDATGNYFNGWIDEVLVYKRALTPEEVQGLYQASQQPFGVPVTPYVQTDIASLMSNVNASVYLRFPFVVTDPTNVALLDLRVRYDDGYVAYLNGAEVARGNAPAELAYNATATNTHTVLNVDEVRLGPTVLRPGTNVLAVHGLNIAANDEDFLVQVELVAVSVATLNAEPVYFTVPSPGEPNSAGTPVAGPAIIEPSHTPNVPGETDDLHVTVRVRQTFHPVNEVLLHYRVMFGQEVTITMQDDGQSHDGAAGDGVYGATIPAGAASSGEMIRWYFTASDAAGNTMRWPLFVDPANSAEYLGTIVQPTNLVSKLPIVHIFAAPSQLSGIEDPNKTGGRVSVFHDGEFYDNVYMRVRGNTTRNYNKKSHRLIFNPEHPFRHPGPGGRIRKTSFVADYPDPTYMRQGLSFWLCNEVGAPAPFYYPMRLQLNGEFYQLANHNDLHSEELLERLGYDPNGALYNAAGTVQPSRFSTGGFDKKTRNWDNDADYSTLANAISEARPLEQRRIALFDMFDVPEVVSYLVAARWVHENDDVWANMSLYHDNDGDDLWRIVPFDMNLSWGAIFAEGDRSLWDGIQATNDNHKSHPLYGSSQATALSGPSGGSAYNRVYDVFFLVPDTRQMYLRRMRTMLDTYIKPPGTPGYSTDLEKMILAWRDLIAEEAARDRAKWGWPGQGGQSNFRPGIDVETGVREMIEQFIWARRNHFYIKHSITNTALPIGVRKTENAGIPLPQPANVFVRLFDVDFNPASGNQAEEYVALTNPTPFAIDLSGWRLDGAVQFTFRPSTVIPSNSVMYVSPDVKAFRNRATPPRGGMGLFVVGPYRGQLSARGETIRVLDTFGRVMSETPYAGAPSPAQQYLRITELMYNPAPDPAITNDAQAFEYIELKNIGPVPLDLAGVRFVDGVTFDFTTGSVLNLAPGASVLVVRDQAAFTARYGAGLPIAGQYSGHLQNGGERIRLVDASNEEILDFSFNNSWYPITDGHGFSLVIVDEQAEPDLWNDPAQWRPSATRQGSPGMMDPPAPVWPQVVINEVLSHNTTPPPGDAIELHNLGDQPADVSGWYLSDDFATPKKFRIPANTVIPAHGFVVFTEAQFNPTPGTPPSFGLGADGDDVWLFSADSAGELSGFAAAVEFGPSENGVSFGRYITSEGKSHFVPQRALTLGAANAGPKVGPVVISEIMYHPQVTAPDGNVHEEYIEILNLSPDPVPLFDPQAPTNTWRLRGDADLDFPTNLTLAAGERLLLVNFDPAIAPALAEAFRMRYGLAPEVPLLGPYTDNLDNNKADVELKKPVLLPDGTPAWVTVDKVDYRDSAPWPVGADGFGLSLQRIDPAAYGNDPINWTAAPPTPGDTLPAGDAPKITAQPQPRDVVKGQNVTFSVSATGTPPLHYQWLFNGVPLAEATAPILMLESVEPNQAGTYAVLVHNAVGSVLSVEAPLVVRVPADILTQPQDQEVFPGDSATFSVVAFSAEPLRYQWMRDGQDIPGATNSTLIVANVGLEDQGTYQVRVIDPLGEVLSRPAWLRVLIRPYFEQVPLSQSAPLGGLVVFSAQVTNTATVPIGYRWRRNGATIWMDVSTNRSSFLVLTNVQPSDAGRYDVVVTNAAYRMPGFLSRPSAMLTILNDTDTDGMPDEWETAHGFNPNAAADADLDADGDGQSNREEYVAGTDPQDPQSYLKIDTLSLAGSASLSFLALSNQTYSVLYTDDPGTVEWQRLVDIVAHATNRVETVVDPAATDRRFYRLTTPRLP